MGTNQLHLYSSPCRLCLNDDEFQLPIFEENAQRKKILLKIQSCLPILKVTEDDPFPKTICYKCLSTLDTLYEFWQKCCSSETILRSRFSHNPYDLVPYQKAGYNIENLEGIEYPPYAHYRMRFPRSVSQSTRINFAESDSEDDWPVLNSSKKRSKMCIPKTKRNVKPSNDTRILKQEASYNIESVQPAIESVRNRRQTNWNKNASENYRMDASLSLLEILEGDSYPADEYHEAHDVEQNSSFQSQHNPSLITAISNIPDRDLAANFCKLSTDKNHMDIEQNNSDCKDDKQVLKSPRSKMPLHQTYMKKFSTEQTSGHNNLSTSTAIYCQTSSESNLLPNNLVIPNGWLPESTRNQQNINTNYDNTTEEMKRNSANTEDKPFYQESTIINEKSIQDHQQMQAHGKIKDGRDLSYLLMNISKSHEGEAFTRTRNLLSRLKTHLNDSKQ